MKTQVFNTASDSQQPFPVEKKSSRSKQWDDIASAVTQAVQIKAVTHKVISNRDSSVVNIQCVDPLKL